MERPDLAASIDAAAEVLVGVLDTAVSRHRLSVSPTQLRVLSLLSDRPEINVNGLAELLDVVPSSASRLCDRLEAIGLVRRMADPRDRREVRLIPTAAAESLLGEVRSRRHEAVQAVLDRMPARMQQDLLRALLAFAQASASTGAPDASARSA
ncbi:DNA-binding transcriptional regulator, MarR family [Micromonospora phaseoli]|uniref:DNA-binding transcriptional regulator, MarR family n=1 Tax=Micromonospora phaseoli TaxID=1144548 RepID=A0A1H6U8J5_9ACTN|nr:MarR family transcriptional regulator [Micromonospora phaseoli]PZV98782.1 DNA-binding MarR family transcriptional regulator [Micromonospora phaseoli]SEI84595.1 DNA-binding transcriptional regulator, MarR family [Micromonospora phaseoli]